MSHDDFDIEKVYEKIQSLKNLKTKLSLRSYTNEDFYKSKAQIPQPENENPNDSDLDDLANNDVPELKSKM